MRACKMPWCVPASGTAACTSKVVAGPEMGTVFGVAVVAGSVIVASMEIL